MTNPRAELHGNSDCPPMFGSSLSDEIALLGDTMGLAAAAAGEIVTNGLRYAFDATVTA